MHTSCKDGGGGPDCVFVQLDVGSVRLDVNPVRHCIVVILLGLYD